MSARDRLTAMYVPISDADETEWTVRLAAFEAQVTKAALESASHQMYEGVAVGDLDHHTREHVAAWLSRLAAQKGAALRTVPAAGQDDTSTAKTDATPITTHWDRTVIHPGDDSDDDTIVCCLTDDGRPVALFLDDELREALGLLLVDPDGDGEITAEPERCGVYEGHGEFCDYPAAPGGTHCNYHADQTPPAPATAYADTRGEPGDVAT